VYWDLTREVKLRFDREGISIPFPQRDVHFFPAQTHGAAAPAAPVAATRTGSGRTALTGQGEPGAGSDT
jgi:small-conductance mechanosensitive channel